MTTTTTTRPKRCCAFTLVEFMIGSTLGAFVMAGVLSTFLMLGRSGANLVNYTAMDAQTRRALEDFAQDVRMASNVTWNSETSITLTVPNNYTSNSNQVTYAWDNTPGTSSYQTFYRKPGNAGSGAASTTYITNVSSFTYLRFDRLNAAASTDISTKRVQLRMTIARSNTTVVTATDTTLSASFVLRNKTTN